MGLFKRGRVWWMSFTHNGERIQRSTKVKDRKQEKADRERRGKT